MSDETHEPEPRDEDATPHEDAALGPGRELPLHDDAPGWLRALRRHRSRIARVAVVAVLAVAAMDLGQSSPSEVTLLVPLTPRSTARVVEVRLLDPDGALMRTRQLSVLPTDTLLESTFELARGRYTLELREDDGPSRRTSFDAPADAPIRVSFEPTTSHEVISP